MKILLIAPFFFEPHRWMISAYKTAHYLSRICEVIVLTTGKPKYEEVHEKLKIYRMTDIFFPDPINYSIVPGLFFNLWKVIRKEKPDIFLINKYMFFTSLSIFLLKFFKKKIITVTDTFPGINWQPRNSIVKIIMKIYAHLIGIPLLKLSNIVILLHEGLIPLAQKYKLNYIVIHNGVDIEKFNNPPPLKNFFKKNNEVIITYIGRLESIKGYYDLLEVANDLIKKYKNIKFLFVGDIKNKENIVKRYQNNRIMFLGHRDDIPSILKTTDIFVLPSYAEGLPNALMEAMASGVACLASDVGGVKVLIENLKTGILFQSGKKTELKKQLLTLISDKKLRYYLGKNARDKILNKFNWSIIINQYLKLFNSYKN